MPNVQAPPPAHDSSLPYSKGNALWKRGSAVIIACILCQYTVVALGDIYIKNNPTKYHYHYVTDEEAGSSMVTGSRQHGRERMPLRASPVCDKELVVLTIYTLPAR